MITTKTEKVWYVGDKRFPTREEAQKSELVNILVSGGDEQTWDQIADLIVKHSAEVVDVLTTTEASRPKARRLHGGTKPRKAKTEAAEGGEK